MKNTKKPAKMKSYTEKAEHEFFRFLGQSILWAIKI